MIDYFERVLRFQNLEAWDVQLGSAVYRMFIIDENRPTKAEDLDLPIGFKASKDDLRPNLITVKIYSAHPVIEKHIEHLDQFSKQLTNHVALAHCNVLVSFYTGDLEEALVCMVQQICHIKYDEISLKKLQHFNQD